MRCAHRHDQRATAEVLSRAYADATAERADVRAYRFRLRVQPSDGSPAFEATVSRSFSVLELKPSAGDVEVPVRFDPAGRATVFDLDGDPRYDADALIARTAARRRATHDR